MRSKGSAPWLLLLGTAGLIAPTVGLARPFAGAVSQAREASEQVVHARFLRSDGSLEGEEWWDEATGATRRIEVGDLGGGNRITVQNRGRIVTWNSRILAVVSVSEVIDPNDPWLADSSNLLYYRRGVEAGRIQLSESGDLDGTPVWVLRANSPGTGSSALYLDKERLLPLRIDVDGRPAVVVHSEEVARAALPAAFFVARHRPAPGQAVYRNRRLTPSDLRRATSFPAYTLGRSYSGFQLSAITLETRSDPRAPFPWQPQLYFGYVQGGDIYADPVISFAELSAKGEQARRELTVYRATGARYRVRIGGVARTVYIVERRAFAVVLGETLVKGQADLPAGEIVAMLSTLRRAD